MDNYYPERVRRICIINAPFWFAGAWKGVSALLPATITDKVQISGIGRTAALLQQFIAPEELPREYSEESGALPLGWHPHEKRLCALVLASNERLSSDRPEKIARSASDGRGALASAASLASIAHPPDAKSHVRRANSSPDLVSAAEDSKRWSLGRIFRPRALQVAHLGDENKFIYDRERGSTALSIPPKRCHPRGARGS
jgi:hypothetical protein